ncbi:MAG: hypothetical protein CFE23_11665 [Flavobacterium sp. BFFFF1]|uniref:T9SS-dependent choice-of-anchor J family protein n=1 Tax=Flavobacterium sp. BFFFF1 TaxID=2015557 RepID=UPI000BC84FD0|nr:choice-of-anchor J domain-containing protein [Flavobacterium sp. BFFFF1]OYU79906.1 MAG: hypothetical protein CFE23_11665 [Flavobacterium sp. BFFFF1]
MKKITLSLFACVFSAAGFAQFSEDFDAGTDLPVGWSVIQGGDANNWEILDITNEFGLDAHSGSNAAAIQYDSDSPHDDYLVTPAITVAAGVNDYFSFWGRSLDPDYPEMIDVRLSTAGATNPADFNVTLQANVTPFSSEDYYKFSYDLSAYVGQTVYIAFYSSTFDKFVFEVDDVLSGALPNCLEPMAGVVTNITDSGATVGWTSAGNAFELEYGPDGFIQGTGTTLAALGATSINLSGLDSSTVYDVYIRQNCSVNSASEYTALSFETLETLAANDECIGAVAIVPGGDFEASAVTSTSVGATDSADLPSCQESAIRDVWFSVVVPADGNVTLETQLVTDSANDDTIMVAYSGDCTNLSEIDCNDDNPDGNDLFSKLNLTGLTPGETIYVAVWQYDGLFGSTPDAFRFSAYNATLAVPNQEASKLTYFPNPVSNVLNLSYDQEIVDVSVTNMVGQQVLSKTINATSTALDLSALAQGTYAVKVNTGNATKVVKVVKQ